MLRKILDSPWPYFALAGVLLALVTWTILGPPPDPLPTATAEDLLELRDRDDLNVMFVVIDTLRSDRVHAYGYERETSPNLDALAARGIRFADVESQSSWTKTSMASIWTGMYPQRTGIHHFSHALPREATLPAEIFKEAGYVTGGVWRNGWVGNNFGFDQGFDLYIRPKKPKAAARNIKRRNPSAHALQGTDLDATTSASEFLLANATPDNRFFLYVHYMDVHQYLYADISPNWGTSYSDFYDSALYWTDHNLGLLLQVLEHQGVLDKTLIVVASDHGEAFFEHGREGHARDLYWEVQQVPLIIVPPFRLDEGIVVEQRVANIDIWPTVLDMVGLPPLPDTEGKSLMPLVMASAGMGEVPEELTSRPLFAQIDEHWGKKDKERAPRIAVIKDQYKLMERTLLPDKSELYDRSKDPGETVNLADEEPEVRDELSAVIDAYVEKPRTQWDETPEVELDEMKVNQLRALGYAFGEDDFAEAARQKRLEAEREAAGKGASRGEEGQAAEAEADAAAGSGTPESEEAAAQ